MFIDIGQFLLEEIPSHKCEVIDHSLEVTKFVKP